MNQRALNFIIFFGLELLIASCASSQIAERPPKETPSLKPPPEHVPVGKSAALDGPPILQIDTGGHKVKINDVIFTKDGLYLVSASNDKTVRVWEVGTGDIVRIMRG